MLARVGDPPEGPAGDGPAARPTWLLTTLWSLRAVGLRAQFLIGSLLAVSLSLTSVLCHVGLSVGQLTAWQLALEPEGAPASKRNITS